MNEWNEQGSAAGLGNVRSECSSLSAREYCALPERWQLVEPSRLLNCGVTSAENASRKNVFGGNPGSRLLENGGNANESEEHRTVNGFRLGAKIGRERTAQYIIKAYGYPRQNAGGWGGVLKRPRT